MFCGSCGTHMQEGWTFCGQCGAPAPSSGISSTVPVDSPPSATLSDDTRGVAIGRTPPNRHRLVAISILVVCAISVGAIAFATYRIVRNSENVSATARPRETTETANATADAAKNGAKPTGTGPKTANDAQETSPSPSPEGGSGEAMRSAYRAAGSLDKEVARFAADRFHPGDGDRATREAQLRRCQELLKRVEAARAQVNAIPVASSDLSRKNALAALFDMLWERADAMRSAADVAVAEPDKNSWNPKLQPRSHDAKVRFDAAYKNADPDD